MSLVAFDKAMTEWRVRLAAMSRNISDLGDLIDTPECADIKVRMRLKSPVPGTELNLTDAQARSWRVTQDQLWACTRAVGEMVDRAEQTVKAAWPWQRDTAAAAALQLLSSEYVELPQGDVSVLKRSLLGAAQDIRHLTLEEMLAVMTKAFDEGKEGLISLVASYADIDTCIVAMSARIDALEATGWIDAPDARGLLEEGKARAIVDPLRALVFIGSEVRTMVEQATNAAAAYRTVLDSSKVRLSLYKAALSGLLQSEKLVSALREEAAGKVLLPPVIQADRASIRELAAWFGRLERMLDVSAQTQVPVQLQSVSSKGFSTWAIGMDNWNRMRLMIIEALVNEEGAYRRGVSRRDELRGRYGAVEAKRRARLASGAGEDGRCSGIGERLKALLFGAITPLPEADNLFCEYETLVSRMSVSRTSTG